MNRRYFLLVLALSGCGAVHKVSVAPDPEPDFKVFYWRVPPGYERVAVTVGSCNISGPSMEAIPHKACYQKLKEMVFSGEGSAFVIRSIEPREGDENVLGILGEVVRLKRTPNDGIVPVK